jgi:hypothetical protein
MTTKTPQGDELIQATHENELSQQVNTDNADTTKVDEQVTISKDDFIQQTNPVDSKAIEAKEVRRKEQEDKNVDFVFNKFVETDEDGNVSFDKVPNQWKWTVDKIKDRFTPEEKHTPTQTPDIDALVNQRLDKREFDGKIQALLEDSSLDSTQKADIRDKFKELKAQ